jgi:2-keto-4-pentenoate hydratase
MEKNVNGSVEKAANALYAARESKKTIIPMREWLEPNDLNGAYKVQEINTTRKLNAGAKRIGRKIGLTSLAVQKQLGVNQPDFGTLFDDMLYRGISTKVDVSRFMQPKIEGEIAFVVKKEITKSGMARDELLGHIDYVTAAFEIVDSAITDWKITLVDTVADNASCGAIVLSDQECQMSAVDVRLAGMVMKEDEQVVSLGVGAASMNDPLLAFSWLVELAIKQGDPIKAGEIVLTGALGPMVPMQSGKKYSLEIAGFLPIYVIAE